jgi:hypothetical protein
MIRDIRSWPKCEVPQRARYGRDQLQSEHAADIAEGPSLTHLRHRSMDFVVTHLSNDVIGCRRPEGES